MDFIIDAIVEWLKGLLVDGIMGNLDGLFDNVNQSVGEIATQVGTTPADWNAGVFSMIRQISETAILPIAGVDVYKRQDMPCIVRNLTDDEAITQMVEDNLDQREEILPSERAKALKMQLEAIKHQGSRTSGQIDPKDAGKRSNEIVAERNKMAVKQVQRYIRLNELVPDLMKLMDEKKLGFTTAVELSYIGKKNQNYIAVAIDSQQSSPSQAQAKRMRELDEKKLLNGDVIDGIMMEDKKEVDKVMRTGAELSKYFGKETTPREMKDQIIKLLDDWKGQQKEHEKPEKKTEPEK